MDDINKKYAETKPYSFGGKYRLYEVYSKEKVDKALKKIILTLALNNIESQNIILQFMSSKKENSFNLMSFFSQGVN